ncbi:MAG TPA: hypothetical protein VFW35_09195 [Sphingomicrobium sp.]|nr:hypothetical protein [Sphingomicrobium sp.]
MRPTHYRPENNEVAEFPALQQGVLFRAVRPKERRGVNKLFSIAAIAAGFGAIFCPQIANAQPSSESRAITGSAAAQAPDASCALPSEPWSIPAALDAAFSGPADKDRTCMRALLIPEARLMFASVGADGSPSYKLETLEDWIARTKSRGHITLEEKQLNFRIDRFGTIAHLWSLYALRSDGHAVARGINSIQAIKEAGGWRIAAIMVQAESAAAPLPEQYLP